MPEELLDSPVNRMLYAFGTVYSDLDLKPHDFAGDLLLAGVGPVFPERLFFADPQKHYKARSKNVDSILVCDHANAPGDHIYPGMTLQSLFEDKRKVKPAAPEVFMDEGLWDVLAQVDQLYNMITFCRIPNLPGQLGQDGLALITSALKPGGKALLSGSYENEGTWNLQSQVDRFMLGSGAIARVHELYDVPDAMNTSNGGHYAVIVEKNR